MPAPLIVAAIAAGAGLLKSEFMDRPKEERQRVLAAETQRYSPWTGLKANKIEEADPMGSAMTFGAAGLGLGQGMESAAAQNKLMEAQTGVLNKESEWLGRGKSPYSQGTSPTFISNYGGAKVGGPAASNAMGSQWPGGPLKYDQHDYQVPDYRYNTWQGQKW